MTDRKTIPAYELLIRRGLCADVQDATRWVTQGKVFVDDMRIEDVAEFVRKNGEARLAQIILPDWGFPIVLSFLGDMSRFWWVVDIQQGPFDGLWIYENAENEARHDDAFVEFEGLGDTSTYLLKPGTFPELAEHLIIDEHSYIAAFSSTDPGAALAHFRRFYLEYQGTYDEGWRKGSELLLIYPDGWWEVYTQNGDIERQMRIAEQAASQDGESAGAPSPPVS